MKNIKTYEGFKCWFSKNKKTVSEPVSKPVSVSEPSKVQPVYIKKYEEQIDSFLDDLRDISIGSYRTIRSKDISYCFCIRNYKSKEKEINIFLEEIESACESIDIKFAWFNEFSSKALVLNIDIFSKSDGEKINYIVLSFFTEKISTEYDIYSNVEECANRLGFEYEYFDDGEEDMSSYLSFRRKSYYGDYDEPDEEENEKVNIKTYEVFKDWILKNKTKIPENISKYEEQIDSFIDDLKDISFGSSKELEDDDLLYSFFIKDYDKKKNEIDIFLEEIESITKSIKIQFHYYIPSHIKIKFKHSDDEIKCIVLQFSVNKIDKNSNNLSKEQNIHNLCNELGLIISDDRYFSNNRLTTLEGAPERVGGYLNLGTPLNELPQGFPNMETNEGFKGFKDWFSKKKEPVLEPVSISEHEKEIDSFLDDLRDISIGSYKTLSEKDIIYSFFIKDYDKKENEINIFLEEIESITKSIGIYFKIFNKDTHFLSNSGLDVGIVDTNIELYFIVLFFSTEKKQSEQYLENRIVYNLNLSSDDNIYIVELDDDENT